jgi:branched-chain amino acid transport system ATP-binding protein
VREEEAAHRKAVEEVLDFTDLERYRHEHVGALPYGIQKIVGFARALAMQPKVLLRDEPSAGLNRDEREDLARHILRIKHELGIPMIWVEHDMQMVADLADRLYVLDHGEPIAEGRPEEVLRDARVIEAYLGSHSA